MSPEPKSQQDHPACPVCREKGCAPHVEKEGFVFHRCPACGFIFCHPRPSKDQLAEVYGRDVTPEEGYQYSKASSRRRRALGNAIKLWSHIVAKRVLDVGCGGGFMVEAMRNFGARQAVGLDISALAIDYAKRRFAKCTFHQGAFHELGEIAHDFDFVYSSEVIEHVDDIDEYARFLNHALKPGGALFLTTPDIGSSRVPEPVTDWDLFSPPLHIQFFTERTLAAFMARHGFDVIRRIADRRGTGLKMLFRKRRDDD